MPRTHASRWQACTCRAEATGCTRVHLPRTDVRRSCRENERREGGGRTIPTCRARRAHGRSNQPIRRRGHIRQPLPRRCRRSRWLACGQTTPRCDVARARSRRAARAATRRARCDDHQLRRRCGHRRCVGRAAPRGDGRASDATVARCHAGTSWTRSDARALHMRARGGGGGGARLSWRLCRGARAGARCKSRRARIGGWRVLRVRAAHGAACGKRGIRTQPVPRRRLGSGRAGAASWTRRAFGG